MDYTKLLNQMIEQSGLSANEICKRCQTEGVNLSSHYLSTLRNKSNRRPSDEISRAIAIVCGKPEDWLVTQARMDAETADLTQMRKNIRKIIEWVAKLLMQVPGYEGTDETIEQFMNQLLDVELIDEANLIDFSFLDLNCGNVQQGLDMNNLIEQLYSMCLFPIEDDAMAPKLPKGGKVRVEVCDYQNGDFLCFHKQGDDTYYIRQARFLDKDYKQVMMIPHNSGYESEVFNTNDLSIHGKIIQLLIDFT